MVTTAERERRKKAADYARETTALEGGRQSPETAALVGRYAEGAISIEEAIEVVLKNSTQK